MPNVPKLFVKVIASTFAAITSWAASAQTNFSLPLEKVDLKTGPGLEVVTRNCVLCHSVDYISTQPRLNPVQWRASVLKMQAKYGASITTNNVEAIVDYLAKNYGTAGRAEAAVQPK